MSDTFLTKEEIGVLTGRKFKSLQVKQLRTMSIPFWIDARGAPVVPRSAIDGRKPVAAPIKEKWIPHVLREK